MGLDQYAFAVPSSPSNKLIEQELPETREELFYWRKHPNLQGWMEKLYRSRGGQAAAFNCYTVKLTLEDLKRLREDVEANKLPKTSGFFFGESRDEDKKLDLEFLDIAERAISDGKDVYYDSWW